MAATRTFPSLLLVFLLAPAIPLSASVPTETLRAASETLSGSGHLSMFLTLQLLSNSLIVSRSPSLTIFSPSDTAFFGSGQPSLSDLLYHFSPFSFHSTSLHFLPIGFKIPTLLANHSLVVTSNANSPHDTTLSINGVRVNKAPIFDNGFLVVLGIDQFFDPQFEVSRSNPSPNVDLGCPLSASRPGYYALKDASQELRTKGFSVVASLLDMLVVGFKENSTRLTIFAPVDEAILGYNSKDHASAFLRHIVPCKVTWSDLVGMQDGAALKTYMQWYEISVKRSGDALFLNDVPVTYPDLYQNDWLVVHGLLGMFQSREDAGYD